MFKEFLRDFWAYSKLLSALIGASTLMSAAELIHGLARGEWRVEATTWLLIPLYMWCAWSSRGASA